MRVSYNHIGILAASNAGCNIAFFQSRTVVPLMYAISSVCLKSDFDADMDVMTEPAEQRERERERGLSKSSYCKRERVRVRVATVREMREL